MSKNKSIEEALNDWAWLEEDGPVKANVGNDNKSDDTGIEKFDEQFKEVDTSEAKEKKRRKPRHKQKPAPPPVVSDKSKEEKVEEKVSESDSKAPSEDKSLEPKNSDGFLKKAKRIFKKNKKQGKVQELGDSEIEDISEPSVKDKPIEGEIEEGSGDERKRLIKGSFFILGLFVLGVVISFFPVMDDTSEGTKSEPPLTPVESEKTLLNVNEIEVNSKDKMVDVADNTKESIEPEIPSTSSEKTLLNVNDSKVEVETKDNEAEVARLQEEVKLTKALLSGNDIQEPLVKENEIVNDTVVEGNGEELSAIEGSDGAIAGNATETAYLVAKDESVKEDTASNSSLPTADESIVANNDVKKELKALRESVKLLTEAMNNKTRMDEERASKEASLRKAAYWLPDLKVDVIFKVGDAYSARVHITGEQSEVVTEGSKLRMWNIDRIEKNRVFLVFNEYSRVIYLNTDNTEVEKWENEKSLPIVKKDRAGFLKFGELN